MAANGKCNAYSNTTNTPYTATIVNIPIPITIYTQKVFTLIFFHNIYTPADVSTHKCKHLNVATVNHNLMNIYGPHI